VVITVFPVTAKMGTIRRNVVLRDEYGECVVCVWGNHTSILNESTIGRSVTFQRVCIQEYEGVCECMCVCSLSLYFLKEHCNCQHQKTPA
jgi:hypothetical protein